jgi:hypothetical protein
MNQFSFFTDDELQATAERGNPRFRIVKCAPPA